MWFIFVFYLYFLIGQNVRPGQKWSAISYFWSANSRLLTVIFHTVYTIKTKNGGFKPRSKGYIWLVNKVRPTFTTVHVLKTQLKNEWFIYICNEGFVQMNPCNTTYKPLAVYYTTLLLIRMIKNFCCLISHCLCTSQFGRMKWQSLSGPWLKDNKLWL